MSAPFITENDRKFACGGGSCGANAYREINGLSLRTSIGPIDLDAEFLDTELIRNNLSTLISAVSEAVSNVFAWINRMEQEFAIKYAANEIVSDISLFNQINVVIVKIKRFKSALNIWLSDFHNVVLDTSDLVNNYNIQSSFLRSESIGSTSNVVQNAIVAAKQNVGKSRSLGKKIKQLLKLDSNIRNNLVELRSLTESFYTGSIRVNDKLVNFREFEQAVRSLSSNDSPLAQIQSALANEINSNRQSLILKSTQPPAVNPPDTNCVYGDCNLEAGEMSKMKIEKLVERLTAISERVLYTETTKPYLDSVIESVMELAKNSDRLTQIVMLCRRIQNNTPENVIHNLRINARNPNALFTRMANVKKIIENLKGADRQYAPTLQEIYDEMLQTASSNLDINESDEFDIDVVMLDSADSSQNAAEA